jgi:hypothetical protein
MKKICKEYTKLVQGTSDDDSKKNQLIF